MTMKTVIAVEQIRTQPSHNRLNIPFSEHTPQAWWQRQVDPSTSVRMLILEEAKHHDLQDRLNRIGIQQAATPPAPPPAPMAGPAAAPAQTAASGVPTLVTDPREVELELLREEVRVLRAAVGTPPLCHIA